jgi:hypothetical protein
MFTSINQVCQTSRAPYYALNAVTLIEKIKTTPEKTKNNKKKNITVNESSLSLHKSLEILRFSHWKKKKKQFSKITNYFFSSNLQFLLRPQQKMPPNKRVRTPWKFEPESSSSFLNKTTLPQLPQRQLQLSLQCKLNNPIPRRLLDQAKHLH